MNKQAAYDLGCQLAMNAAFGEPRGLTKTALNAEQYTFLEKLFGKNVDEVLAREVDKLLASGELGATAKGLGHENMATTRSFLEQLLKGEAEIPLSRELPGAPGVPIPVKDAPQGEAYRDIWKRTDIIDSINAARRAVAAEQSATTGARVLGGGVGIGVPWAIHKTDMTDRAKELAPAAAGLGVASLPIIQGLQSGALRVPKNLNEITGREAVGDIGDLAAKIQRGDVILTGDPVMHAAKGNIIAAGADPHGYHAAIATGPVEGGRLNVIHGGGDIGAATYGSYPVGDRDIIVRRFKDPEHTRQFMENVDAISKREGNLGSIFGQQSRLKMYDLPGAVGSALKDLLPESIRKTLGKRVNPNTGFCTSLVGGASPVCLKPGVPATEVLPHHIQSSEALQDVGKFFAKRPATVAASETALRSVPFLLRGAVGAGLGYGAYRGLKALTDDTPQPIKDVKKWFS